MFRDFSLVNTHYAHLQLGDFTSAAVSVNTLEYLRLGFGQSSRGSGGVDF